MNKKKTQKILVNGELFEVQILSRSCQSLIFELKGRTYEVGYEKSIPDISMAPVSATKKTNTEKIRNIEKKISTGKPSLNADETAICAPIPGVIIEVMVAEGERVEEGQALVRIEAMKMENSIYSPFSGKISSIIVVNGTEVSDGQTLLTISQSS